MSGSGSFARVVMRLTRWIAGPEREEWTAAMAAECDAAAGREAGWALGCLRAAAGDRLKRDGLFAAALIAGPPLGLVLNGLFMVGFAALLHPWRMPAPLWLGGFALGPLVVPFLLGWLRPRRALLVGLAGGLLHLLLPALYMFIQSGDPVGRWLNRGWQIYNLDWPLGLALGVSLWTVAAWLGSRKTGKKYRTVR